MAYASGEDLYSRFRRNHRTRFRTPGRTVSAGDHVNYRDARWMDVDRRTLCSERDADFVRAVATASTPQRTMSSRTAVPRIRLANRVCRIFKSWKIREMTGIEVTATAIASTSRAADLTPLTPTSGSIGMIDARPSPKTRKNGNGVPTPGSRPSHGGFPWKQPPHLASRNEHEQKDAKPIDEAHARWTSCSGLRRRIFEKEAEDRRRELPEHKRTHQDASNDFAHQARLLQALEHVAKHLHQANDHTQSQDQQTNLFFSHLRSHLAETTSLPRCGNARGMARSGGRRPPTRPTGRNEPLGFGTRGSGLGIRGSGLGIREWDSTPDPIIDPAPNPDPLIPNPPLPYFPIKGLPKMWTASFSFSQMFSMISVSASSSNGTVTVHGLV